MKIREDTWVYLSNSRRMWRPNQFWYGIWKVRFARCTSFWEKRSKIRGKNKKMGSWVECQIVRKSNKRKDNRLRHSKMNGWKKLSICRYLRLWRKNISHSVRLLCLKRVKWLKSCLMASFSHSVTAQLPLWESRKAQSSSSLLKLQ